MLRCYGNLKFAANFLTLTPFLAQLNLQKAGLSRFNNFNGNLKLICYFEFEFLKLNKQIIFEYLLCLFTNQWVCRNFDVNCII